MGRPVLGKYFDDILPVDGKPFAKVADSTTKDVELALDVAHQAKDAWAKTSPAKRADILLKIADCLEANLELLVVAETWENGKPVCETFVQYRQDAFGQTAITFTLPMRRLTITNNQALGEKTIK